MLQKHQKLERSSVLMMVCIVLAIVWGGIVEVLPLFRMETTIEKVKGMRPYTPLELAGQNVYIREGCSLCHSQQIRPLRDEVERYGHYSLAAESMYDHPFLWGSKRTGPDLSRVGGKYSDQWQVAHLVKPQNVVPESVMPSYGWMLNKAANIDSIDADLKTLRLVGVPYTDDQIANAVADAKAQAHPEADASGLMARYGEKVNVRDFDGQPEFVSDMDALVAYLQVLGTMVDFKDYEAQQSAAPEEAK